MYCLLEVVSVCPEKLAARFANKIDWIKVSICLLVPFHYFSRQANINTIFTVHLPCYSKTAKPLCILSLSGELDVTKISFFSLSSF